MLKALVKKIEEVHQVIIKFKKQFKKVIKLGLPYPLSTDTWLQPKEAYLHMLVACRNNMQFNIG
jgi:hypothetical protein